jgi:hypothetical protein
MSIRQRLVNAVTSHSRFVIIGICITIMVWASSGEALVSNRSLAYPIVTEYYYGDRVEICGSMECTEEIVHNSQCEICTEELLEQTGAKGCGDRRVDTDIQTPQQTTEDPKGCMSPYWDKTTDEDGNPIPIYCSEKPVGYNCADNNLKVAPLRFVCCPKGWDYKENPPDAKCVPISVT